MKTVKIIPTRTMRLGGQRVEVAQPVDVSESDAQLALRHGWAIEAPEKGAKADDKKTRKGEASE